MKEKELSRDAQIGRIQRMEEILDKAAPVIAQAREAMEKYREIQSETEELIAYYTGPDWRKDFEADERGLLPSDLKRGVLSEDAVYDLISDRSELLRLIRSIKETEE